MGRALSWPLGYVAYGSGFVMPLLGFDTILLALVHWDIILHVLSFEMLPDHACRAGTDTSLYASYHVTYGCSTLLSGSQSSDLLQRP